MVLNLGGSPPLQMVAVKLGFIQYYIIIYIYYLYLYCIFFVTFWIIRPPSQSFDAPATTCQKRLAGIKYQVNHAEEVKHPICYLYTIFNAKD